MQDWLRVLGAKLILGEEVMPTLVVVMIFLGVLFFVEGLYLQLAGSERRLQRKIHRRLQFVADLENKASLESLIKADKLEQTAWHKRLVARLSQLVQLEELLLQADISWSPAWVLGVSLGLGTLGGLYCWWRCGWLGGLGGFLGLGLILPRTLIWLKKRSRMKQFEKQLPEALGLIARSLKAGHSFPAAMQMVSEEMPDPIGLEFFKTFKEYNYGLDLTLALQNLYRRNQIKDLKFFITAVSIQRETGGNLVEILEKIASLIRDRFKLLNQVKSLTAEGRLSGLILVGLPIVIALILYRLNPGYISLLWTHPTGKKMLAGAVGLQLLGMLFIKKIVSIKV